MFIVYGPDDRDGGGEGVFEKMVKRYTNEVHLKLIRLLIELLLLPSIDFIWRTFRSANNVYSIIST